MNRSTLSANVSKLSAIRFQRSAALVFLSVSAYFLYEAQTYPYLDETGPGAGFFAVWIGILGLVVGLGLLLTARSLAADATKNVQPMPGSRVAIALTVAMLVLAAIALETFGFRITAFLLLSVLLRLYGSSWGTTLTIALVGSLLVFFVFQALHVRLPVGAYGI